MEGPKIDLIVPVFNVEKYLDNCMRSLLSQTYKNYEVILVDDGSTDLSADKCDYYSRNYKNVRVIHKQNGGLSDARNVGMDLADGEYVIFIDSDDYIATNSLECFVKCIRQTKKAVDIVIGGYIKVSENEYSSMSNVEASCSSCKEMTGREYLISSLSNNTFVVTAWSKLYRTRYLVENNFKFKKGILHEDELYTPQVLLKASNVVQTDLDFYRYVIREGSITTSKKQLKNAISIQTIVQELDWIYEKIDEVNLKRCLMNHSATIFYQAISRLNKEEAKNNNLIDYAFFKTHSLSYKNRLRYFLLRLKFGLLKKYM